jgi:hypothetical protein
MNYCSNYLSNVEIAKYSFIYDNNYQSLLIRFVNFEYDKIKNEHIVTEPNKNGEFIKIDKTSIKNFVALNEELNGKEYEIVVGDIPIYSGKIKLNRNLFPVDIFPLHELLYHKLFFLVRDVKENLDLNFQIEMTDEKLNYIEEKNFNSEATKQNECCSIDWPLLECMTCKEKTNEFHDIKDNKQYLRFVKGMCGIKLHPNCYEHDTIYKIKKNISANNTYSLPGGEDNFIGGVMENGLGGISISVIFDYNVEIIKIKEKLNNLSEYMLNNFIVNKLVEFGDYGKKQDGELAVMAGMKSKCSLKEDNRFEYHFISDAINGIELYCLNNKINKISLVLCSMGAVFSNVVEFIKFGNKYKLNSDLFINAIYAGTKAHIVVFAENNNPIEIKYNLVAFGKNLRRSLAMNNNSFLIIDNMPTDGLFFKPDSDEILESGDVVVI